MGDQKPAHISDHIKIDKDGSNESGESDPILNSDANVFVEPLLSKESKNAIVKASYQN